MIGLAVHVSFLAGCLHNANIGWAARSDVDGVSRWRRPYLDRDELLARTDVVEITTSRDVAYRTPRTYRAVALAKLLEGVAIPPDAVVEAAAQDGFVTQLLAIWSTPTTTSSRIWQSKSPTRRGRQFQVRIRAQAPSISYGSAIKRHPSPIMKWPYQVVSLSVQDAPAKRWPSLAVDPPAPFAAVPIRRETGRPSFVNKCFTCQR